MCSVYRSLCVLIMGLCIAQTGLVSYWSEYAECSCLNKTLSYGSSVLLVLCSLYCVFCALCILRFACALYNMSVCVVCFENELTHGTNRTGLIPVCLGRAIQWNVILGVCVSTPKAVLVVILQCSMGVLKRTYHSTNISLIWIGDLRMIYLQWLNHISQ